MARTTLFFILAAVLLADCHAHRWEDPHGAAVESAVKGVLDILPVPHSRRRALLQGSAAEGQEEETSSKTSNPQCAWDEDRAQCAVNPLLALGFLEKAPETKLKDLIVDMVKCHFKNKDTCGEDSKCRWDGLQNLCDYAVDVTEMDSFRKCVGVASVFLETTEKIAECRGSLKTEDSCNISKECGWEEKTKTCSFDLLKYLTGVPSHERLPRGLAALLLYRGEEMATGLQEEGDFTDAEQVLDWTPPPFTCPDGVDQIVCHVAEQSDDVVKTDLYCGLRQAMGGDCEEDEKCQIMKDAPEDAEVTCEISDKLQKEGKAIQREVYLEAVANPVAASVMRKEFECIEGDKDSCDGDCVWNEDGKMCGISGAYLFKTMAAQPVQYEGDATCHLVQQMFLSGCLESKEDECGATPETKQCSWDAADELCIPGPLALMDILFEGEDELKAEATEVFSKCHSVETEADCA
ncbi:hypothetical protein BSKO_01869 [Bryopsis sp. KO-2023]|nr:hypothetical protein BSKO_01869 [Bryopsis sp. KO-2023]